MDRVEVKAATTTDTGRDQGTAQSSINMRLEQDKDNERGRKLDSKDAASQGLIPVAVPALARVP